jgi:hypothetical protein
MLWSPTIRAALFVGTLARRVLPPDVGRAGQLTWALSIVIRWSQSARWCSGSGRAIVRSIHLVTSAAHADLWICGQRKRVAHRPTGSNRYQDSQQGSWQLR